MPDSPYLNPPDSQPGTPFPRRLLLRIGAALGVVAAGTAAAGMAAGGAAASTDEAGKHDAPDAPGGFGAPPAAGAKRRRASTPAEGSTSQVRPGRATGPENTTASGVRLAPNAAPILDTPLSRRATAWKVEG